MQGSEVGPAGWYADPNDGERQRYWDGAAWTDTVAGFFPDPSDASRQRFFDGFNWGPQTRPIPAASTFVPIGSPDRPGGWVAEPFDGFLADVAAAEAAAAVPGTVVNDPPETFASDGEDLLHAAVSGPVVRPATLDIPERSPAPCGPDDTAPAVTAQLPQRSPEPATSTTTGTAEQDPARQRRRERLHRAGYGLLVVLVVAAVVAFGLSRVLSGGLVP